MSRVNRPWGIALVIALCARSAAAADQPEATSLRITRDNTTVSVFVGDRPAVVYRYAGVPYKPYIEKLYSPDGVNILRDSPADHKHHHGLMFALTADGVDFWGEFPDTKPGSQMHRGWEVATTSSSRGVSTATLVERLQWVSADKQPILTERRTIIIHHARDLKALLLTWKTQLQPAKGNNSVTLSGSHYVGLGMRFIESMDTGGRFFNATGKDGPVVRGTERLVRAKWCAYRVTSDGKPVTVAIMDDPDNAHHPTAKFTMTAPFAYLSATLDLRKTPLTITADKPLKFRCGVSVSDEPLGAKDVENLYQRWINY